MNISNGQSVPNERTPIFNNRASSNYGDSPNDSVSSYDDWEYPGSGSVVNVDHLQYAEEMPESVASVNNHDDGQIDPVQYQTTNGGKKERVFYTNNNRKHLGQLRATAIAGNDITSSIFYTVGVATLAAGKWTPVCMILVILVLYMFRTVYSEVCTALPLNGGTYNVLLNTTSKSVAAVAAALSLLSYLATAVVSANSAASYAAALYPPLGDSGVFWGTIVILGIFALLTLMGLSESANVALVIFLAHLATLLVLAVFCVIYLVQDWSLFVQNWNTDTGTSVASSIYFGFSTALLGVSGFESSANYIEEQKDGVYPKTLRNMWLCIAFFNPLISILSLGLLPIGVIWQDSTSVLAKMAEVSTHGQRWLSMWVSIDAIVVLSGGVLTSYVGVTGLARNMSSDRCLPQFLLLKNAIRGTNHWIIIGFFGLTTSLMWITGGKVQTLGGVYTIAFLSVMTLFSIGNLMVKYKRNRIPRQVKASWFTVIFGILAVLAGLIGNIMFDPIIMAYFMIYFSGVMLIVFLMFARVRLLKMLLYFMRKTTTCYRLCGGWIKREGRRVKSQDIVFFAKTDDIDTLNKAILYVLENEITNCLKIVHVYEEERGIPPNLEERVRILDQIYPKLKIDLVLIKGEFTPKLVDSLANYLQVPKNFMFITCPSDRFPHTIDKFGGVRVVTH